MRQDSVGRADTLSSGSSMKSNASSSFKDGVLPFLSLIHIFPENIHIEIFESEYLSDRAQVIMRFHVVFRILGLWQKEFVNSEKINTRFNAFCAKGKPVINLIVNFGGIAEIEKSEAENAIENIASPIKMDSFRRRLNFMTLPQ